jgi:hypothetical protein
MMALVVGAALFLPIFLSISGASKWRDRRIAERYEKVENGLVAHGGAATIGQFRRQRSMREILPRASATWVQRGICIRAVLCGRLANLLVDRFRRNGPGNEQRKPPFPSGTPAGYRRSSISDSLTQAGGGEYPF